MLFIKKKKASPAIVWSKNICSRSEDKCFSWWL